MRKKVEFLWMVIPAVVVLAFISIYPFIFTVYLSFTNYPMIVAKKPIFCGFENWLRMFSDVRVAGYWGVTLQYAGSALILEIILGLIIALLLHRIGRFQEFLTTLSMVPMFFAPVLVGLLGRFLFHDTYGVYTYALRRIGLLKGIRGIWGHGSGALLALVFLDVWEWTPLVVIIILAGIKSLPVDIFEAAQIDGATPWQETWHLTLPLLKQVIFVALVIRAMDVIKYFDHILVTTRGGPADATKVISIAIYDQAFQAYQMGYAATLTVSTLVIIIFLAQIFVRLLLGVEEG